MPALTPEPDLDLLARFRGGDPEAFAQIVSRYGGLVFSCCLRVTGDAHRAEDLAQETFFRLSKKPEQVSRSLPAWLHKVATRLSIDSLRRADARRRHEGAAAVERDRLTGATDDEATWADLSPRLDTALQDLPEPSRDVLVRHFFLAQPQRDMAGQLGVSQATVSRRVALALDQLRKRLTRTGLSVGAAAALASLLAQAPAHAAPAGIAQSAGGMSLLQSLAPASAKPALLPLVGKAALIGLPLVGAGVGVVLVLQWAALQPRMTTAPTRAQTQQLAGAADGTDAPQDDNATVPEDTPPPRPLVRLPVSELQAFSSTHIVAIEQPTGDPDATLQAVYADGHVATLTERAAGEHLYQQTGRTLDTIVRDASDPPPGSGSLP